MASNRVDKPTYDYSFELHALKGQVLLIASNDGRGEPSALAEQFHRWLRAKTTPFSGVRYSVYASADTSENFYEFAQTLDSEFRRLGATQIMKHLDSEWPSNNEAAAVA